MFVFLRNLMSSVFGFVLIFAFALLALFQKLSPIYQAAPEWEDYNDDPSFELTVDEDAYQASLYDVNSLRKKCFYGTNQYLSGSMTAVVLYVNDFESSWTDELKDEFTEKDIKPALEFLENEAQKYGVELDFNIKVLENAYYDDEVIIDLNASGQVTVNVLDNAAEGYDFYSDHDLHDRMVESCGTDVLFITVFNKPGISYGLNPKPGTDLDRVEHTVTFAIDLNYQTEYVPGTCAPLVANGILYLYGGESLNKPSSRRPISQELYPTDIMRYQTFDISDSNIGEATAYYIGWIDYVPEAVYSEGWNESE